jgi:hypothetical protein
VGTIHYIGIYELYTTVIGGEETTKHTLLSMQPLLLGEVAGMTAQDHRSGTPFTSNATLQKDQR